MCCQVRRCRCGGDRGVVQQGTVHEGMRTLRHDGADKVVKGMTTIDEVRATSNASPRIPTRDAA